MYSSYRNSEYLLYLLVGGPVLLGWGLRRFRETRLIEDTPTSRVRSAAIGRVELAGMARQFKPDKSPVSKMDACWWDCQVQELQQSGKNSHWVTLTRKGSNLPFYLEDATGRILVNPIGADFRVLEVTHDLNSMTRTSLEPVFMGWGINDMNWFGGTKKLRILEQLIPECAPLYIMGEMISTANLPSDRQEKLLARLRAVKSDAARMSEADLNKDGTVDAEEWDHLRTQVEESFAAESSARRAQSQQEAITMIGAPASGSYLIATGTQEEIVSSSRWRGIFAIYGGIALTGLGVWMAILQNWQAPAIVALVGIGLVISLFIKKLSWSLLSLRR